MKTLYILLITLIPIFAFGQVEDRSETDCDGNTMNTVAVGEAGMPLIVSSHGFDCSNCQGQAGNVAEFANEYAGQVEVWGAMTYLYSSAEPTCNETENWRNTYGWDEVFMFPDVDSYWFTNGTPNYHVIDPETHEVVYEGASFSAATETALGFLTSSVGHIPIQSQSVKIYSQGSSLDIRLNAERSANAKIDVINIVGQQVSSFKSQLREGSNRIEHNLNSNPGVYLLKITIEGQSSTHKFVKA